MKHLTIIFFPIVFICACLYKPHEETTTLRIIDGYIVRDVEKTHTFYLQDMESADLIELKFINDDIDELSFSEFGHVEVIGQYNSKYNFLMVDQILGTDELMVLKPIGRSDL